MRKWKWCASVSLTRIVGLRDKGRELKRDVSENEVAIDRGRERERDRIKRERERERYIYREKEIERDRERKI